MIIEKIKIKPYQISFKKEYQNAKLSINQRKGWIIEIHSNGEIGYGDACPLDGFSVEGYSQSGYGLEGFKLSLRDINEIEFDELLSLSEAHGELQPSVEFAIQSAAYDLISKLENISLNKYLSKDAQDSVMINYYSNNLAQPFDGMVIKLKINDTNLFTQLDFIDQTIDKYNGMIKLRLDLNGSYDLPTAIRLCKMIENKPIDYIEQPLPLDDFEGMYELSLHTDIPLAVDECITGINSIHYILESQCADVFVLKPMLIGGVSKLSEIIQLLRSNSKRFNISSLLESNVGRLFYLHLSSAFKISEECGISTDVFFESDICKFPSSSNGSIEINNNPGIGINEIHL